MWLAELWGLSKKSSSREFHSSRLRVLMASWALIERESVKYYTDPLSISADEAIKTRKREEWNSMLEDFLDNPQSSANHLVFGMNKDQRDEARGKEGGKTVHTWI